MIIKTLISAAAATMLLAGAAQAGQDTASQQPSDATSATTPSTAPDAQAGTSMPSDSMAPSTGATMSATAATTDASAVVTTKVVTNGPVADTPENRAKYGQPMSRAGKRTAAAGNYTQEPTA
jgi:hypothetical protein